MEGRNHRHYAAWSAGGALAIPSGCALIVVGPSSAPLFLAGSALVVIGVFCATQAVGHFFAVRAPAPRKAPRASATAVAKPARVVDPELAALLTALCVDGAKIKAAKPRDHAALIPLADKLGTWLLGAADAVAKYGTGADTLGFKSSKGTRGEARQGMYKPWGWALDEFEPQYAWFCRWAESRLHTSLAA
jgi:hypothetical protein